MAENSWKVWTPLSLLESPHSSSPSYVITLLNQPVADVVFFLRLWNGATYRSTVDGGTTVWHRLINNTQLAIVRETPDLITGDFDSVDWTNVEHFRSQGARVVETKDQDRTDFTKNLMEIGKLIAEGQLDRPPDAIVAFVENTGRFDHIMANIQTLFLAKEFLNGIPVYLISSQCVTWLLEPGQHTIRLGQRDLSEAHCGLIPMAGPTRAWSSGLKWNLCEDSVLEFGGLVSTSNSFDLDKDGEVKIRTDSPVLFTMECNVHP